MTTPFRPQAGKPDSWFTRIYDSLCRLAERRALREMMVRRSDRLLADIGFSREDLAVDIEAFVEASQQRREIERQIRHELAGYSDRDLNDIGIHRDDIRRVAREHAQQAVQINRFGPVGTAQANDNTGQRPGASRKAA